MTSDEALAALRVKLGITRASVVFTRTDGRTVTLHDVRVDSIGPSGENAMTVGVEFYDSDRLVHVPFVESWEIEYTF